MEADKTVLLVDDDPDLVNVHSAYLELLGFNSLIATNGKEALGLLEKEADNIDIILSDVEMPEMSGYEFCRTVKESEKVKEIPFLFVSGHTNLEEKLKGYGVGGDDYINKPITPEELSLKINTLLEAKQKNRQLTDQLAETHNTAMQAMTYSSDLGQIMEFYKSSLQAESYEQLADYLFAAANNYGLKVTLHIISPEKTLTLKEGGEASPLEANVIELSRPKGRYFDFGSRTVINFSEFSLLIKNMPVDDPERYGTVKDILGTLCNAIEARIKVINSNSAAEKNEEILETVKSTLQQVEDLFKKVQQGNLTAIETLSDELEEAMLTSLGLNEAQEDSIREIVKECLATTNTVYEEGMVLEGLFDKINEQLRNILGVKA